MQFGTFPHPRILLHVGPHADAHHPALRMLVSAAVPAAALVATGRTDLVPYALLTSVAAVYGRRSPVRRRVTMQLEVALVQLVLVVFGATLAQADAQAAVVLIVTAVAAGLTTLIADIRQWMPPGALFPTFAVAVSAFAPLPSGGVPVVAGVGALSLLVTFVVTLTWSVPTLLARSRTASSAGSDAAVDNIRTPLTVSCIHAGMCALAGASAGLIALAVGLSHPYWAVVSAVVPVFGLSTHTQLLRAGHRLTGTVIGLMTSALLFLNPWSDIGLLILVGLLIVGTELTVARNYSIALAFVTPMTIAFALLGASASLSELLLARVIETVLGLGIVVVLILMTRRFRDTGPP